MSLARPARAYRGDNKICCGAGSTTSGVETPVFLEPFGTAEAVPSRNRFAANSKLVFAFEDEIGER